MEHCGTQSIQTKRLMLRSLCIDDAKSLHALGCLESTYDKSLEIVQTMIKYNSDIMNYNWVISYEGKAIGRIKVNEISTRDNYMQISYDIGKTFRNKGFITEAVRSVIGFLFDHVKVHRIYGQCRVTNIASIRVLQKVGMTFEGRQRNHYIENDGTYTDVDIYGILTEENNNSKL
jgi:ribosomal-protein-alanine N-acetyltransferase